MPNTNFQTIFQMPGIVNNIVKQATGRDSVSQIDMDFVTVGQDKQTVPHAIDYTAVVSFVNNNQLPLTVLAKINAVQSGTGDPSPTNVRPITGWTGAKINRTGKNLLGGTAFRDGIKNAIPVATESAEDKYIQYSASANQAPFTTLCGLTNKFKANTAYTFIMTIYKSSGTGSNMCITYTDGTTTVIPAVSSAGEKQTVLLVSDATKTVANLRNAYSSGYTRVYYDECGIFEGSLTADDFEPYKGETFDITFPDPPETVYGGTLNVTTGVLTVTMGEIESYNGETLPGVWMSDRDVYAEDTTPTEGTQVVYELAEPVTYQCTPEVIKSLIGNNHVFADTGNVAVSYTSYIPVI